MKILPLTRGVVAWIDDEDYALVSARKWSATPSRNGTVWYARTGVREKTPAGKPLWRTIRMHNEIMGPTPPGMECDHVIHHPPADRVVDNRRANLRFVTRSGNLRNGPLRRDNTCGYKGVCHNGGGKRIFASVRFRPGKSCYLGQYATEVEAAYAYDMAALYFFGDEACTNFPIGGSRHALRDSNELTEVAIAAVAWKVMEKLSIADAERLAA